MRLTRAIVSATFKVKQLRKYISKLCPAVNGVLKCRSSLRGIYVSIIILLLLWASISITSFAATVVLNDTGLVADGLSIMFDEPVEIIESSEALVKHEQVGNSMEWEFGNGEVQPFGSFWVAWKPDSAKILNYTWHIKGILKWQYDAEHLITSSPTIAQDGTVYFGNYMTLCALSSDGFLKWEYAPDQYWGPLAPDFIKGAVYTPSVGIDGSIYFGAHKYFYSLSTGGVFRWRYIGKDDMAFCPAAIASDGTIYVTIEMPGDILAFNPNGSLKWVCKAMDYRVDEAFYGSPAIGSDGTVYAAGCWNGVLYAMSPSGVLKWECMIGTVEDRIYGSPGIGVDGTIYVGCANGSLYAVSPEGKIKWEYKSHGAVLDSVAIDSEGTIYFGSWDHFVYALDPNGVLKWRYKTGGEVQSTPAIDVDGTIYVGSNDSYLYAVRSDGSLKWRFKANAPIQSSPAIVKDTIYFSTQETLYALRTFSSGIMQSVWPMFGRDPQHSGRVR